MTSTVWCAQKTDTECVSSPCGYVLIKIVSSVYTCIEPVAAPEDIQQDRRQSAWMAECSFSAAKRALRARGIYFNRTSQIDTHFKGSSDYLNIIVTKDVL